MHIILLFYCKSNSCSRFVTWIFEFFQFLYLYRIVYFYTCCAWKTCYDWFLFIDVDWYLSVSPWFDTLFWICCCFVFDVAFALILHATSATDSTPLLSNLNGNGKCEEDTNIAVKWKAEKLRLFSCFASSKGVRNWYGF